MGVTLITGASGFVGSHLVAAMTDRGLATRPLSRAAAPGAIQIASYAADTDWPVYLEGVDTVVHLAARVHVMRETEADPLTAFRHANVDTTLSLAEQAARAGVRRFVFMSTIKVNGEETRPGRPFTNLDPRNPGDAYAMSKAEAEVGLLEIARQTGMDVAIIRPPLIFGPGVGGNFATLMKWTERGTPSVFSQVENRRSLIYIGNLTDFIITLVLDPQVMNRHFLVSDQPAHSTHELIQHLAVAFGRSQRVVPVPHTLLELAGRLTNSTASLRRLLGSLEIDDTDTRATLSWRQPYDFATGIIKTVGRMSKA